MLRSRNRTCRIRSSFKFNSDDAISAIESIPFSTWQLRRLLHTLSSRNAFPGRYAVSKFIIEPHFRLQEWVAEEKGYFRAEGLDYEFRELIRSTEGQHHNKVNEGAFQSIEKGREADISGACHWTVNVAASSGAAQ